MSDQPAPADTTTRQQLDPATADAVRAYAARTRESADQLAAVLENIAAGCAEACGDLREGVVPAEVDQADKGPLVRREFAAAVTLTGDDEHGYPLDQGVRQVECGRIGNQRGSCADELRR